MVQPAEFDTIRRMRFACWVTKAIDKHSEYNNKLLTAIGLSPGGSGYFTCKQNMKLVNKTRNWLQNIKLVNKTRNWLQNMKLVAKHELG